MSRIYRAFDLHLKLSTAAGANAVTLADGDEIRIPGATGDRFVAVWVEKVLVPIAGTGSSGVSRSNDGLLHKAMDCRDRAAHRSLSARII